MKASEYFGDWMDVIDTAELRKILSWISTIDKTTLCPPLQIYLKPLGLVL